MDTIVDWDWDAPQWSDVLAVASGCADVRAISGNALWPIYGPLLAGDSAQALVIGQIGQSLDGRIATAAGHSHYINGTAALVHLHRLRALVVAVVVGVGTVVADDPQLTVRRADNRPGMPQPARVVIDPAGRTPATAKCFAADGARRIVIGCGPQSSIGDAEYVRIPAQADSIAPEAILAALRSMGLNRILVEGGAATLSRFVAAGALHRLHLMTGPLIIGSGPVGLNLPEIARLDAALRPAVRTFLLPGGDVLFDCAFGAG
jgi:riboflavin-specific deaminase-like protein